MTRATTVLSTLSSAVALSVAATNAAAALLANDTFSVGGNGAAGQYQTGQSVSSTNNASLVTPGFVTGGYTVGSQSTGNFVASNGGLNTAQMSGGGGQVTFLGLTPGTPANTTYRAVSRSVNAATFTVTAPIYYTSTIVRRGDNVLDSTGAPAIPAAGAMTGFGFTNAVAATVAATNTLSGFYLGFAGEDGTSDNGSLVIRSRNAMPNTLSDTILVDGRTTDTSNKTYQVYTKSRQDFGSANGAAVDEITFWVNPTDVSSEARMSATALSTGVFENFSFASGTLNNTIVRSTFASTTGTSGSGAYYPAVAFDEARVGTDLASVVPEPTTLAALAGVALVGLRRRRA